MAFQGVPNTAEAVITYLMNGENQQNIVHAELPGGYTLPDLVILAGIVDFVVGNDWLPIQTVDASYVRTTVRGLAVENDLETVDDTSAGAGAVASNGLPGNVTFSVKKASPFTGRSARGRLYWIGLPTNRLQPNENLLNLANADEIEAAIEAMRVGINTSAWDAVIVSRFTAGAKRTPTGLTFPWAATQAVNINVDSQRRRLFSG